MSFLLASWLVSQVWTWDKAIEADVVSYRLYWGASGTAWCSENVVEVPAATACNATQCQGDIPMPDYTPAYIVVVAVDSGGLESPTEHGPVVVCP